MLIVCVRMCELKVCVCLHHHASVKSPNRQDHLSQVAGVNEDFFHCFFPHFSSSCFGDAIASAIPPHDSHFLHAVRTRPTTQVQTGQGFKSIDFSTDFGCRRWDNR